MWAAIIRIVESMVTHFYWSCKSFRCKPPFIRIVEAMVTHFSRVIPRLRIYNRFDLNKIIIHIIKSPYNFSKQNCPLNGDRVQVRFQFAKRCIIYETVKAHRIRTVPSWAFDDWNDVRPSNYHENIPLMARILYFWLRDLTSLLSWKTLQSTVLCALSVFLVIWGKKGFLCSTC